jgi:glycosyltransferase involved in cell wall biosynthesis
MRWIAETDTLSRLPRASIIPNPIDTTGFPYLPKDEGQRLKVLLIRPFNSRKYANDIAIDAIAWLSRLSEFAEVAFSIYGQGRLFESLTSRLRGYKNVSIHEGFLTHAQIAAQHAEHGVFLCPTRQDAQGVSMCEAMSSGLVPVTTPSSAIPDFVSHDRNGLLASDARAIAAALSRLFREPALFLSLSRNAAADIREKCAIGNVVGREVELMETAVAQFRQMTPVVPAPGYASQ